MSPDDELTGRQREVYDLIVSRMDRTGRPPTMREIGAALGITSTNGVRYFLEVLEERGYIERDAAVSRGIRLPARRLPGLGTGSGRRAAIRALPPRAAVPSPSLDIPIVGAIAAGAPLLAEQNLEGTITVDPAFLTGGDGIFALRVRGDSMKDAGILSGDLVIVRPHAHPAQGDIVVAFWDGEATVKRFFRRGRRVTLHPENEALRDIQVGEDQEDFRILGIVTGVIRRVK